MKVFLTGGTIGAVSSDVGVVVDDASIHKFNGVISSVVGESVEQVRVYNIDSQKLNIGYHSRLLLGKLSEYPDEDLIITTGTDTVKWLTNLVSLMERESGNKRKIVILSSMMNQSEDGGLDHIKGILSAGKAMLEDAKVPSGVYVGSSQNPESSLVSFYDATGLSCRLTKLSLGGLGSLVGSHPHFNVCGEEVVLLPILAESGEMSEEDAKAEMELIEKSAAKPRKSFPTLPLSDPSAIKKYYSNAVPGDAVVCEIGSGWIDGPNAAKYQNLVKELSDRGVTVSLCNRMRYDKEKGQFVSDVRREDLERLKTSLAIDSDKVQIISSISTAKLYTKLAFDRVTKAKHSVSASFAGGGGAASAEAVASPFRPELYPMGYKADSEGEDRLGLRYIPDFAMFDATYTRLYEMSHISSQEALYVGAAPSSSMPQIAMEALVGGVIPNELISRMQTIQAGHSGISAPSITLCPTYGEVGSADLCYAASATDRELEDVGCVRRGDLSSRDFFRGATPVPVVGGARHARLSFGEEERNKAASYCSP